MVPPAKGLLQEADGRARLGEMRIFVRPGADEALGRRLQPREKARHGVRIPVRPAAHREHWALDRAPILADRSVLVEIVPPLMPEPVFKPEAAILQALHPQVPPFFSHQHGVGRRRIQRKHG